VKHFLSVSLFAVCLVSAGVSAAATPFYISIPGPTLSYTHLYYGQENGIFAQEGLDVRVLVVRGIIGLSSLMSGEIDLTCHAGSGLAAALRGLPVVHNSITSPAELKGKAIAIGSLEGTAAVITRRILEAKGLDPQKDVTLLSMDTTARLQSLLSGKVPAAMVTPPTTYLALEHGFHSMARGRDHLRYLQTGIVATEKAIKQKPPQIVRFLRGWNRALKFYQDNPEIMIPYIQKKLRVSDARLARRMYEEDAPSVSLTGVLTNEAAREILETGREALRLKETVPVERVFDFSPAAEALR
jgi:ABC-type nitrate/sulfonate/bicarbonate transport system substrate-binding protein